MFQKPAFGSNTSGFGMQSTFGASAATTSSPFGGFKSTGATSAFGAPPAFGASATAQPATGGGLFGTPAPSTGLFGASTSTAPAPAFGASTSGFGFGASTSGGGLFANNTTTPLFGNNQNTTAFGAKPAGFGFGNTTANTNTGGGLFGNTSTSGTGLFGQSNALPGGTGSLFGTTTGAFGQQQQANGTAHAKYNPVVGTDVIVKSGTSQNINIKHHCITCMKEYEGKSLEELRLEDYTAGRKGATGGVFGFQQQQENKPLFGGTTTFGQPATTSGANVFGGGGLGTAGGFGQTNTFSFGGSTPANTNTTGLFGANKPAFGATSTAGTGLFGSTATTQASTFGTNSSTFGFGSNLQTQPAGGLFGAKPATSVFGAAPASTGFGSFGGGGLFGQKPQQTQAPTFGGTTGVGTLAGGFGTNTSTSGGFFGVNSAFGKPATTQPAFGFTNTQPTLGGLNTGLGANTFQNKGPTTGFPTLGGGGMFQQPAANNSFRTGLDGGLGGGIFGNNSGLGSGLGLGLNANNSALNNSNLTGASAAGNVHEQILTLAARPYGDSPLFKDLLPESSTTAEDVLKPTNPTAVSAVLERAACRVTSPAAPLRVLTTARPQPHRKSLFDGLEESDASLEEKLTLRPSRKRLVLRPNQRNDSTDDVTDNYNRQGSLDEPRHNQTNGDENHTDKENSQRTDEVDKAKRNLDFPERHNNLDISSDRQASWLSSPKPSWNEKEKSIDNEPTPRLYPNLDKELPSEGSERRASWLTTKTLRKPLAQNPECVESSVRELGVRSPSNASNSSIGRDKENMDSLTVSEEEHVAPRDAPPHPTGIKLTRPGYYTIPTLDEMINYMRPDGSCVVPHLTIGRTNYGNVYYDCEMDVAGLDLDALVHFLNKEVIVYPCDADKPPVGVALNRRAVVTLDRIWPRDKTERRHITDPERLIKMDYEGKLRRVCDKHDTKFIEYRPQTGSWVFRVEHFSKYGLTDSDEEDDVTPEVLKRQLVTQALQKAAPTAPKPPAPPAGLGGLGMPSSPLGLSGPAVGLGGPAAGLMTDDNIYAMHQTSLNLLNGAGKAFEMDTTEDNGESQSLYQDSSRAYGVKSPTAELARLENRQSHNVQLMKASLYADSEMEEDVSVSTGDQLVPMIGPTVTAGASPPPAPASLARDELLTPPQLHEVSEVRMKPLIVKPHTVVLRYHRKVPPFKDTIAGKLNAACISDMSVCRARHSRVGFGRGAALVYVTAYNSIADLPDAAWLCDLSEYVGGREPHDWSEPVVARLAICQPDSACNVMDVLARQLDSLFAHSTFQDTGVCPRLQLHSSPAERRLVLTKLMGDAQSVRHYTPRFGVSGGYCYEVWQLCEALWGADLENDGIPGTDDMSIVSRHRKLLEWMTGAVRAVTDQELSKPIHVEDEDECDKHSARIWTLLLGGRVVEACRVARDNGDLNMATLIAQGAGDPSFRSLISRQLSLWRECGADALMSSHRRATLQLLAGGAARLQLADVDWMRALHATARFLCPQVPTLERVIHKYESLFKDADDTEEMDLSTVHEDLGVQCPVPPYLQHFSEERSAPRPLDLRYELIRARALHTRAKMSPAHYTEDPADYSLSFLLNVWFGTIDAPTAIGVAEQLEAAGLWHRAVQALLYIPDDKIRAHLVKAVLSRNAPSSADTAELQSRIELIRKLRVPDKWLLLAMAHRAKYEHKPSLEVEHLVGAEEWNAAHKLLIDKLLPDAVLADNLQSIAPILSKLQAAAMRHEVHGWQSGGQAVYQYLQVCDEIRAASAGSGGVATRLEGLRPAVVAACNALSNMPDTGPPRWQSARCELGARLVQLCVAGAVGPDTLALVLGTLRLPPDCTAHATHKITMDMAERASELCLESTSSSPISSHQRTAAVS